ncbi:hypothetical protein CBR_g37214 [Chara braunii]|uniref:tRNA (guanine(10)-N(2))-methyltransferase n=1 Tax=Chara braunii TaxID=69332 RepID=A0A388LME3_CHABU|nr:hypothetical protein CBR_g37214 [Chara braunii]|eukprot:GBG83500.1 hypothetical protein CBR_g37214 [Chara braunii]
MWYLCYFIHRHLDFRIAEVESLARIAGCCSSVDDSNPRSPPPPPPPSPPSPPPSPRLAWRLPDGDHPDSPFWFVDLPSNDAALAIVRRGILLKGVFEVWGEGATYDELENSVKSYLTVEKEKTAAYLTAGSSFKIVVDGFGKIFSMQEQIQRIERLSYIPFQGKVNLKSPDHKFWLIESVVGEGVNNGLPPRVPRRIYFAREVGCSNRTIVSTYTLSKRRYLGPTSMDAEMAFIMANQALAMAGKLIYDPFVGTGSVLIAAAHYGAYTVGADIDIRVVRDGRGRDRNIWSNFQQYGLMPPLSLLRVDNNVNPWRTDLDEVFDSVLCDPPYGVRAGGRKSGGRKMLNGRVEPYVIPEEMKSDHIPSTAPYTLEECLQDMLDMASRLLVMGGRLVFFFPVLREEYKEEEDLPRHACLHLVANSEQILTRRWSRRLLTYEKVTRYTADMAKEARAKHEYFRINHLKFLEEARAKADLRAAVFAPRRAEWFPDLESGSPSMDGGGGGDGTVNGANEHSVATAARRPRYRGKNV